MTITIHPCPFCGHDDVCIDEIAPGIAAICCDECMTIGPHCDGAQTTGQAIEKWNQAGNDKAQGAEGGFIAGGSLGATGCAAKPTE